MDTLPASGGVFFVQYSLVFVVFVSVFVVFVSV